MSDKKISYETRGEPATIIAYIKSLVEGLEKGRVILAAAEEEILLYPSEEIDFKVKARVHKGEGRIVFKLSWNQDEAKSKIRIGN
ncbi:MAG: amphi-Trp domain-containing protein [Deltaproteobacteria bacterium]|nr:amphi-Trp domain-containing protein [Deltaproteobacteria bacterium]